MADRIQLRRGTHAEWALANPILSQGEMGLTLDTPFILKIGDAVLDWASLPIWMSISDVTWGYILGDINTQADLIALLGTQGFQTVLTNNPVLTQNNTIDAGGFSLDISGGTGSVIQALSSNGSSQSNWAITNTTAGMSVVEGGTQATIYIDKDQILLNQTNGIINLFGFGVGTFASAAGYILGVDASGKIVEVDAAGLGGAGNIYTIDGALTGNRLVNFGNYNLQFLGGEASAFTLTPTGNLGQNSTFYINQAMVTMAVTGTTSTNAGYSITEDYLLLRQQNGGTSAYREINIDATAIAFNYWTGASYYSLTVPENNGVLAFSVNGEIADATGNITLPLVLNNTEIAYGSATNEMTSDPNLTYDPAGLFTVAFAGSTYLLIDKTQNLYILGDYYGANNNAYFQVDDNLKNASFNSIEYLSTPQLTGVAEPGSALTDIYGDGINIEMLAVPWVKGQYDDNTAALAAGLEGGDMYSIPISSDKSILAVVKPLAWTIGVTMPGGSLTATIDVYNPLNLLFEWGDGTYSTVRSGTSVSHTYAAAGNYTIGISGTMKKTRPNTGYAAISFNPLGSKLTSTSKVRGVRNINAFAYTFNDCPNLTSIPADLFQDYPDVWSFYSTFTGTGITSIPAGLFAGQTKATQFQACFVATPITTIPAGLFTDCVSAVSFYSCFWVCTSLTAIPATLLDNCPLATQFDYMFANCGTALTGAAPQYWLIPGATGLHCFVTDTNLSNFASIPTPWKT